MYLSNYIRRRGNQEPTTVTVAPYSVYRAILVAAAPVYKKGKRVPLYTHSTTTIQLLFFFFSVILGALMAPIHGENGTYVSVF